MSRRRTVPHALPDPDLRYGSVVLSRFVRRLMRDGKYSVALRCVYDALDRVKSRYRGKESEFEIFIKALENVKPVVEVRSRRVGGATHQIPTEVRESRRESLGMRWVISAARSRTGRSMGERLGAEILDAFNQTGSAYKKKEDVRKMAEANRAFMPYKW